MTTDSSLRTPAAEILPVPKMRKGARQSACMPEREIALLDPYPSGYRDDHRFIIANPRCRNSSGAKNAEGARQSACVPDREIASFLAVTVISSLRAPAAEILPVPKMRKGALAICLYA
jgi:hypothetical protein